MGMESGSSEASEIWPQPIDEPPEPGSTPSDSAPDAYYSPGIIPLDSTEIRDLSEVTYDSDFVADARASTDRLKQAEITVPGSDDPPQEARSVTADSTVEFARSALKSLAWQAAESASAALSPLGPVVVRSLYIANQIETMIEGTRSGAGFDLKVSIPGLDFPIEDLDAKLEVLARLHVGGPPSDGPTTGTFLEVQFYEPPTGRGDVASHHQPSDPSTRSGIPPVRTEGGSSEDDPWEAWLNLVGEQLIRNLSWALAYVASLPAGTVQASVRIGVLSARPPDQVP